MVPQYYSYGSAGVPAVPATIFMSAWHSSAPACLSLVEILYLNSFQNSLKEKSPAIILSS